LELNQPNELSHEDVNRAQNLVNNLKPNITLTEGDLAAPTEPRKALKRIVS